MAEEFNVDRVLDLLEVVHKTVNLPNLGAVNKEAMSELLKTNAGLEKKQAEDKKKAEEEAAKAAMEAKQKADAEAKLKAEKEKQYA